MSEKDSNAERAGRAPAENYVPQAILPVMRRQAWKIWSAGLFVIFVWNFLIVSAPVAAARSLNGASAALYKFFGYICHQIDGRSFHIFEHAFAVCSRCFGVYFGLLVGFVIYPLLRPIEETEPLRRFWLFLAMIPIGIDWSLGVFGLWENTHLSRFATGAVLGTACGIFIVPALVEIFWHLTGSKYVKKPSR